MSPRHSKAVPRNSPLTYAMAITTGATQIIKSPVGELEYNRLRTKAAAPHNAATQMRRRAQTRMLQPGPLRPTLAWFLTVTAT